METLAHGTSFDIAYDGSAASSLLPGSITMEFDLACAASSPLDCADWKKQIQHVAQDLKQTDSALETMLTPALTQWDVPFARVVFGGRFSAGKSCAVNASLKRSLLPVDDLPETGIICVLRNGSKDSALIRTEDGPKAIPCTTEAIREQVALVADSGERREGNGLDRLLELTLADAPIPARALWMDSPGIDDSQAMTACARYAADCSDILVWTINSSAPLSEMEVKFVNAHISKYGPHSVVFLLNAFLSEDTAETWTRFEARNLPRIRQMLAERLDAPLTPPLYTISARALTPPDEPGFGRAEWDAVLQGFDSPEHPVVFLNRVYTVTVALRRMQAETAQRICQEQDRQDAQRREIEAGLSSRKTHLTEIRRHLRAKFDACHARIKSSADSEVKALYDEIAPEAGLHYDDHYAERLQNCWRIAIEAERGRLSEELAQQIHAGEMPSSALSRFTGNLLPARQEVEAPQHKPEPKTNIGGAAAGALAGFWVGGPIGAIVCGLIGAGTGDDGKTEALKKDAEAARANLMLAQVRMLADFETKAAGFRKKLSAKLERHQPSLPVPDTREMARLQTLGLLLAKLEANGTALLEGGLS